MGRGGGGTEFFFEVDDAVFAQFVRDWFGGPVDGPRGSVIARFLEACVGFL